ncbi:C-type mannose receptor 2 [Silurus meridionalis]|uniref:C-type lectin domain-containing protein n=1 Tax=Silurus meridionalis TaxID=175797 RepID=A0A8T0B3C6_SILME|nr:hypothetical protein HF521_004078 [Silurus meridionalis]KAI5098459.1 C-type mannose receptor 2 [Silurus meridionalis]
MNVSVFLLLFLGGIAETLRRDYVYVPKRVTWTEAQRYCTQNYGGLATITADEQNWIPLGIENFTDAWIGLIRSPVNTNIWLWYNRQPSVYFKWCPNQPNNYNNAQNCVVLTPCGWNDLECRNPQSFFCNNVSAILVKEEKTWEEAREFCRTHYTGLASMSKLHLPGNDPKQIPDDSVWTGLRFLNGNWTWMSGELLGIPESLTCTPQLYSCGAYNVSNNVWESRNCYEKLNFYCY